MKLLLFPLFLGLFLFNQDQKTGHVQHKEDYSLVGTWELENFYYYDNNEVSDTVATTEGYRQLKMFTKNRVMWTRFVPKDSVEWFGYGVYVATDNQLIETLEYGSASMMKIIDTLRVFTFELQLAKDTYSQITLDAEGNRFSSENYKRVE